MLGERDDVGQPLAKRWQRDRNDVQPIKQILAKQPLPNQRRQIAMRCRDDAHIDLHGLAADRRHDLVLKHAQYLGLHRGRHIADLVEE